MPGIQPQPGATLRSWKCVLEGGSVRLPATPPLCPSPLPRPPCHSRVVFIGQAIHEGGGRHGLVEGGVKHTHLPPTPSSPSSSTQVAEWTATYWGEETLCNRALTHVMMPVRPCLARLLLAVG